LIPYSDPPQWFLNETGNYTLAAKRFMYRAFTKETISGYQAYRKSYEIFAPLVGRPAWPPEKRVLIEWCAIRAEGSTLPRQGQLKPDSIASAFSALRAVLTWRGESTEVLDDPLIKQVRTGIKKCFTTGKVKAEPISAAQLEGITLPAPELVSQEQGKLSNAAADKLNMDAAFKVAFAGFLRTKEVTYEIKDLKEPGVFEKTKLLRKDIHFSENDEHVVLRLRSSKTDLEKKGVEIVLPATGSATCPVKALRSLTHLDPQGPNAPLFNLRQGAFTREKYVQGIRDGLSRLGVANVHQYAGHSFRRGAAQHASDNGILDEDIQRLGRWTSDAFKGYFNISLKYKFLLARRFLTGRSVPVINTSLNV
jgi:hypothetical protein